ncbi:MAG: molybdenum cofactor biosynthesis protein MoaE [Planctomycetes bacterium]|nr:molybdenum cofactor biosynthesis protein MoaE [Planctomycetota bacterium]
MAVEARLTDKPIDANALLAQCAARENGAQLLFLGVVREQHQGRKVTRIDYEAYEGMALKQLQKLAEEIAAEFQLADVLVVHRTGRHEIGDASLAVIVGSPHRGAAFDATRKLVDRLKHEVPIWKREYFADGSVEWVLADKLVKAEKE